MTAIRFGFQNDAAPFLYFEKAQRMDHISNGFDLVCYKISKTKEI